jgi:hypothetical protein
MKPVRSVGRESSRSFEVIYFSTPVFYVGYAVGFVVESSDLGNG